MLEFARSAIEKALNDPRHLSLLLGEWLTEPKPSVWFDAGDAAGDASPLQVVLDRRTRMLYDAQHVFINGEGFSASGQDARLMRTLADQRRLTAAQCARLSAGARDLLSRWQAAGWLHER